MSYLKEMPQLQELISHADHYDEKCVDGEVDLREFIAGFLSYDPFWIRGLYRVRAGFVRLLGMKQPKMTMPKITPDDIPFIIGQKAFIFEVSSETTDVLWVASADDDHLKAYIAITKEPDTRRFHVGTIVYYHKWSGPIYFNVIRPFHHIVVRSMMQAGASYCDTQQLAHHA